MDKTTKYINSKFKNNERMTLDDAINDNRLKAKAERSLWSEHGLAEYYDQIANWLEELKDARMKITTINATMTKCYNNSRAEGESAGITRVLDILEQLDSKMLEKVKDILYEQDFDECKKTIQKEK